MKSYRKYSDFFRSIFIVLAMISIFVLAACDVAYGAKSILEVKIDSNGNLVTVYSDGTEENLGKVVGENGISLANVVINDAGELIVTFSNGESNNLGLIIGKNGEQVDFNVTETHIEWKYKNESAFKPLIELSLLTGAKGTDGKEVELQVTETHIQWRYVGEETWKDLVSLALITGPKGVDGKEVEFKVSESHIQWRYVGEETWKDLISLSLLTGAKGTDGKEVELGLSQTHITWRYVGEETWKDLVALELITGPKGEDGKEIELRTTETHIEWRYEGTENWTPLIELSLLTGAEGHKGKDGKSAYQLYLERYPDYTGTEAQWIDDLVNGRLATKPKYAVTFDSNGGTDISIQYVFEFEKLTAPETPKRAGYLFGGWYLDEERWVFNIYLVSEPITLVARWIENPLDIVVDDLTVTYNGEVQKYELNNLPEGVIAHYTNNEHKNAGVYEVTISFEDTTGTYLVPEDVKVTFTIEKATVTGISFTSKDIKFNGELQTLTITGNLPSDVIVQYTPNTRTYAGRLEVIAVFIYDYNNYNVIPNMKAELAIYYEVTFVEYNKTTVQKYYTDITSQINVTRPGYTFVGWSTVQNNRNNLIKYPYKLQGHTTLYAIYQ